MYGRSPGLGAQTLHPAQPVLPPSGPWRVVQGLVVMGSPSPTPASVSLGPGFSQQRPGRCCRPFTLQARVRAWSPSPQHMNKLFPSGNVPGMLGGTFHEGHMEMGQEAHSTHDIPCQPHSWVRGVEAPGSTFLPKSSAAAPGEGAAGIQLSSRVRAHPQQWVGR